MKFLVCLAVVFCTHLAYAELIDHSTLSIITPPTAPTLPTNAPEPNTVAQPSHQNWFDKKHEKTKLWLSHTANHMDKWFGKHPNKSANASLRLMMDVYDDKYNGTRIKPKIRGRLRLPALEHRLSVIIGDDDLDYYDNTGWHITPKDVNNRFDKEQIRTDNTSFALSFSKWKTQTGITTDADIGMRSGNDVYGRLRAEKKWQGNNSTAHLEQIYRYGTKSAHFLRTNFVHTYKYRNTRSLTNHAYVQYSHNKQEELAVGNTLYQTHSYPSLLGEKRLSYGANAYARLDENAYPNSYGVFVNYRQPIWRQWLFMQGEMTYYNNKLEQKDHHLTSFLRLEAQF